MDGLGQLGEPITLTSIAAAAGVIAGIVGALKQVGDIFGGGKKESADFDESKTDAPENNVDTSNVDKTSLQFPGSSEDSSSSSSSSSIQQGADDDYSCSNG